MKQSVRNFYIHNAKNKGVRIHNVIVPSGRSRCDPSGRKRKDWIPAGVYPRENGGGNDRICVIVYARKSWHTRVFRMTHTGLIFDATYIKMVAR